MDRVLDLTAFVFQVYRRSLAEGEQLGSEDLEKMRKDDWRTLPDSIVFAATDLEGRYLATIRIMEKGKALLPVERDFGLDVWGVVRSGALWPIASLKSGDWPRMPGPWRKPD